MARWQRDPRLRKRLTAMLVTAEVVALTACFYPVFTAYLYRGLLLIGVGGGAASQVTWVGSIAGTVGCLVGGIWVGLKYAKGLAWARRLYLAGNVGLTVLGVAWFAIHQVRWGAQADNTVALAGLLLPMVTLFPLLWPLLRFRPRGDATAV